MSATLKPVRYDFPARLRGLSSAERELRRLERSMSVATHRGDSLAFAYLDRRHKRASQAVAVLRRREQYDSEDTAPTLGSSRRAHACTDTRGDGSGDR